MDVIIIITVLYCCVRETPLVSTPTSPRTPTTTTTTTTSPATPVSGNIVPFVNAGFYQSLRGLQDLLTDNNYCKNVSENFSAFAFR